MFTRWLGTIFPARTFVSSVVNQAWSCPPMVRSFGTCSGLSRWSRSCQTWLIGSRRLLDDTRVEVALLETTDHLDHLGHTRLHGRRTPLI